MSVIELPAATKRSLRFKRFSWNRAEDGTFPPIDALTRSSQQSAMVDEVVIEASSNASCGSTDLNLQITAVNNHSSKVTIQQGRAVSDRVNKDTAMRPHQDMEYISQNVTSGTTSCQIADGEVAATTAAVPSTAAPQKKNSKAIKKRKGVYLGPSWDDEAGTLPTSANASEVDFDTLLSQMQTHQRDDSQSMPAPSKRKKLKAKNQEDGQAEIRPDNASKRGLRLFLGLLLLLFRETTDTRTARAAGDADYKLVPDFGSRNIRLWEPLEMLLSLSKLLEKPALSPDGHALINVCIWVRKDYAQEALAIVGGGADQATWPGGLPGLLWVSVPIAVQAKQVVASIIKEQRCVMGMGMHNATDQPSKDALHKCWTARVVLWTGKTFWAPAAEMCDSHPDGLGEAVAAMPTAQTKWVQAALAPPCMRRPVPIDDFIVNLQLRHNLVWQQQLPGKVNCVCTGQLDTQCVAGPAAGSSGNNTSGGGGGSIRSMSGVCAPGPGLELAACTLTIGADTSLNHMLGAVDGDSVGAIGDVNGPGDLFKVFKVVDELAHGVEDGGL
ncbi:hypothetical protein COEREDRAFT_8806 [Coemansia reversa NRRL 1564]|uniref:Uncharacterized protein n=1 Tax=Coemansia reversa (strain ATCC 12441 / NRRL 1564) TaxID=763665 RepID=A0A2G5BAW0_COERN|nr:hypothetical protein COEREDRAFT_8806 [Coemansia reversa NRRL 1564]|eukprot:PIA16149.1 hypothetical protein COEREDRAFT_8806 [Coemansia reversa NRRL 1564]